MRKENAPLATPECAIRLVGTFGIIRTACAKSPPVKAPSSTRSVPPCATVMLAPAGSV